MDLRTFDLAAIPVFAASARGHVVVSGEDALQAAAVAERLVALGVDAGWLEEAP